MKKLFILLFVSTLFFFGCIPPRYVEKKTVEITTIKGDTVKVVTTTKTEKYPTHSYEYGMGMYYFRTGGLYHHSSYYSPWNSSKYYGNKYNSPLKKNTVLRQKNSIRNKGKGKGKR